MNKYVEENRGYITPSKLKLYLKDRNLFKLVYVDEVDTSYIKDSPALATGTMIDQYVLSPLEFARNYVAPVGQGLKADLVDACEHMGIELTGKEKVEELKALVYKDKQVLTQAQMDQLEGIFGELQRQPLWRWGGPYKSQVSLYADFKGLKLKGTMDRFHYDKKRNAAIIRDLKSTSDMKPSTRSIHTQFYANLDGPDPFKYKLQLAFYVHLVKANYPDVNIEKVIIDGIGTYAPYFYEAIEYPIEMLEDCWTTEIEPALTRLAAELNEGIVIDQGVYRDALCNERYYALKDNDSAIQREFDVIGASRLPEDLPEEFNRDDL